MQHFKPSLLPYTMEELTTRLDDTGEAVQLKLKEKKRLKGYLVAIDEEGKPLPNQPEEVPSNVSLSDKELEEQFQALSASDKLKYNQWYAFQHEYQCKNNIAGTATQIICHISNQNKPNIPPIITQTELADVEVDEDLVQIVRIEDKDGNVVKRVKPILIKRKYHKSMHLCSHLKMMMLLFSLMQREYHFMKYPGDLMTKRQRMKKITSLMIIS